MDYDDPVENANNAKKKDDDREMVDYSDLFGWLLSWNLINSTIDKDEVAVNISYQYTFKSQSKNYSPWNSTFEYSLNHHNTLPYIFKAVLIDTFYLVYSLFNDKK